MKQGSSYHYYQNDHLGTPRKLTNNVGAETWGATYQAYGAANVAAAGATNNLRFPGQYGDPETGLYHNFQRNYDPGTGGYLEQDPFGVAFTGANRHWYAAGNPGIYSDPTGEIIPAVIVWGAVLWLGGEAISGFPTLHCAQYLWDRCLYAGQGESCGQMLVSAATSFGIGAVLKGAVLVGKPAWKYASARLSKSDFWKALAKRLQSQRGAIGEGGNIARRGALPFADRDVLEEINETLSRVKSGSAKYPGRDGSVFENRPNKASRRAPLPAKPSGYYKEYTVDTPGATNRGRRRLVIGGEGEIYYTHDHYESFVRIG